MKQTIVIGLSLITLAGAVATGEASDSAQAGLEGTLRATGQSAIEKPPQDLFDDELVAALDAVTERAGFEPAVRFDTYTGLANRRIQPLCHLSGVG